MKKKYIQPEIDLFDILAECVMDTAVSGNDNLFDGEVIPEGDLEDDDFIIPQDDGINYTLF